MQLCLIFVFVSIEELALGVSQLYNETEQKSFEEFLQSQLKNERKLLSTPSLPPCSAKVGHSLCVLSCVCVSVAAVNQRIRDQLKRAGAKIKVIHSTSNTNGYAVVNVFCLFGPCV